MRSAARIGLITLYLVVTVGLTIATHFCGGEPVSAGLLGHPPAEPADCCGTDEPMDGCCSTVVTTLHLVDDHMLNAEWTPIFSALDLPEAPAAAGIPELSFASAPTSVRSPHDGPPLHILHGVLLI